MNVEAAVAKWWLRRKIEKDLKARGLTRAERKVVMTAGMKSSEFWMSLVAVALKWIGPHLGMDFPNEALLGVVGYAVSRGIAKFGKAPAA